MKTEAEVRAMIRRLDAMHRPCTHDHNNPLEKMTCQMGNVILNANLALMCWVLGDDDGDFDRLIETIERIES